MLRDRWELLEIEDSTRKHKRYVAVFHDGDGYRSVHFGDNRYEAYVDHHDKDRRQRYRMRHQNDNIYDPMSPGCLSWYILWGNSTDIYENIRTYRTQFDV